MSESLQSILRGLDFRAVMVWTYAEVEAWPEGQLDRCLASGLFVRHTPALRVACLGCGEIVNVLPVMTHMGEPAACLLCGECRMPRVPVEYVSRWKLDFRVF